jgi:hypothetical protein
MGTQKIVTLWKNRISDGAKILFFEKVRCMDGFRRSEESFCLCVHTMVNIGDFDSLPSPLPATSAAALHDLVKKGYSPGE